VIQKPVGGFKALSMFEAAREGKKSKYKKDVSTAATAIFALADFFI
jgi:hypothetical protein